MGAHGIQLTGQENVNANGGVRKVQEALANNLWTGDATDEDKFVYDVYSVDFAEQGGALHGQFLRLQSDFVASVVQHLAVGKTNARHQIKSIIPSFVVSSPALRCVPLSTVLGYLQCGFYYPRGAFDGRICRSLDTDSSSADTALVAQHYYSCHATFKSLECLRKIGS